jgi:heptosyltransferase I
LHAQSNFRLLVVRLGAMGDILHALPAVTALRIAHPNWVIDWVVEPRWRALLAAEDLTTEEIDGSNGRRGPAQPLVDRIFLAPTKEWGRKPLSVKTFREIGWLRRGLRADAYDAVLDFQGAVRSAAIGRMARTERLIGEARPREFAAGWLFSERVETRGVHVIEQDMELADAVAGESLTPGESWLPVSAAAEAWCDQLLAPAGARPPVLINPGAGWGAKRWPVERYAEVAAGLIRRGFHVLVNAGPGEELLAQFMARETRSAAIPLTCTLGQLIALTRRIQLAIAGDTGPLHLASALGRPVVGIFGPTDPGRNGPFGTRFRVLRSPESRRDHTRHAAPEAGMLTISPEDVLSAADELLQSGSSGTGKDAS